MNILSIETSTGICSVALSRDGECLKQFLNADGQSHAKLVSRFIEELMHECGMKMRELDAVALSQGPGSYTGLRIGTSTAKGICYALDIPLYAIDTLQLIAWNARMMVGELAEDALLCPMIDARRMEVYDALYNKDLERTHEVQADIIDEESFKQLLDEHPIYFCGDGAEKCAAVIKHRNAHFLPSIQPEAQYMHHLVTEDRKVDVAYFDPFYLKEYQATVSKNKLW